jgi:hypothetical protein
MAARTPHYRLAGLEPLGGKSRRWRDTRTGEILSYNAGRRRIEALSAGHRGRVTQFERALARTRNVEQARRDSGLSKRGLDAYRKSFVASGREGASPWIKAKGRWRFDEARFRRVHTFIDIQGEVQHVAFGGRDLIAMQDYRATWSPDGGLGGRGGSQAEFYAWLEAHPHYRPVPAGGNRGGSQAELDAWLKAHPRGVIGDDGVTYFPETDLKAIHARIKRMPPRERKSFAADVRYVTEAT